MEKLRRKRINNSLEQLRVLLPYSANMKKDMASLLEQTVEYINIMHTVLNEDKPACLNKVYLSYREKTEQIERFRKNFKKNVNKRSQSDAGCSWSQPYASFGQQITDTEPYIKHPCMNNPYYETNTMGNQMWQQQKITESFLSNPVNFSGSNQNQFFATQPSNLPPRSIYYPPPTKQPDVTLPTNLRLSDETTNSKSVLPPPASKFESWQPVHSSTTEQVCSKAPSLLPNNVDWHHPTFNPTGQLFSKYGLSGKFQIGFYDENNNNTTLCEESVVKTVVEPKQHIPCNQTQDVQENPKVPNPINSDTNIKISTPAKPGAVPEMYFNQETTSTASKIYGGGSTWPPLPPLTLNQNNFLSTQAQMSPRKENNENKKSNSKED